MVTNVPISSEAIKEQLHNWK